MDMEAYKDARDEISCVNPPHAVCLRVLCCSGAPKDTTVMNSRINLVFIKTVAVNLLICADFVGF